MSLLLTFLIDAVVVVLGWILIAVDRETGFDFANEPAIVGLTLTVVGITTFFGIYMNLGGDRARMRSALAASVWTLYVAMSASILVIADFAKILEGRVATDVLKTFSGIVVAVTGYYFASRTVENVNDRIQQRRENVANGGGE
jgi:hypothetical protein